MLRLQVVRPAAGSVLTAGRVSSGVGWLTCDSKVLSLQVSIAGQMHVTARLNVPAAHLQMLTSQKMPEPSAADAANLSGFVFRVRVPAVPPGPATMVFAVQTALETILIDHPVEIRADPDSAATQPAELPAATRRDPPQAVIELLCEEARLSEGGGFAVKGWAVCWPEVETLTVMLDGEVVGNAGVDESRPDIGDRYPHIEAARRAGFRLVRALGRAFTGEHALQLTLISRDGRRTSVSRVVRAEPSLPPPYAEQLAPQPAHSQQAPAPSEDPIRFFLDTPSVQEGVATEVVRGFLSVSGWAVARTRITRIEVFADGVSLGQAHYGIRRGDVAASLPDYDGLLSGFAMVIAPQVMTPGLHRLRIVFEDDRSNVRETEFSVRAETVASGPGPWALRSKLPQSEIMLKTAILAAKGGPPRWHVVVACGNERAAGAVEATLRSLRDQALPDWRATLLTRPELVPLLSRSVGDETGRIAVAEVQPGRPLADLAEGATFMALLTAGDRLGEDALLELSVEAVLRPQADFLYSDEQRTDPADGAVKPFFKPDWSPDLLLSTNYIGRVWAARPALVAAAGLLQDEVAAGAEYDAVLRLSERAGAVHHVAKVLCAAIRQAPAPGLERQALRRAMRRRSVPAQVQPWLVPGTWRIRRPVSEAAMVSIIIPTIAAGGLIEAAIGSIRRLTRWPRYEIVCLDNIPRGGTPEQLRWKAWIAGNADRTVEIAGRFNWSRFNNRGARAARGDYLLFLNDDIEVQDADWLHGLVEQAQRPEIGVVGPQLLYADGRVQHAGMFLAEKAARHAFRFYPRDEPGPFGLARTQRDVISVTGACMLVRRDVYDAVGGFDERHAIVNNDLDFNLRVRRAGYGVLFTPYVTLLHREMASRAVLKDSFNTLSFQQEWGSTFLEGDPYFSPHLSRDFDDYLPEPEPVRQFTVGHPVVAKEAIRRILAVKVDHIGDFITAFPALRRIKQHFPGAELTVLAAEASLALAAMEPAIDRALEFNFFHARSEKGERAAARKALRDMQQRLSAERFDLAIDLRRQSDTRHLLRHTGARWLAGFDRGYAHPWLDFSVEFEGDLANHLKREHVADSLIHLVDAVAANCDPDRSALAARPDRGAARDAVAALLLANGLSPDRLAAPLVCVHTGAGSVNKQWPGASFAGLIGLLTGEAGAAVMIIGGPDEVLAVASLLKLTRRAGAVADLTGKVKLADLPGVIAAADLYVGNDSGPKHIAAALGVPTVGIHSGSVDAGEWGPMGPRSLTIRREMTCSPCYLARAADCHRGLACLTGIRVSDVWQASRRMLALVPG